jgi:hypothetical protein
MMGQRIERWQEAGGDRRWLALLVDAMEEASRPEVRAEPCEAAILQALRAQLAQPARASSYARTPFSLLLCAHAVQPAQLNP